LARNQNNASEWGEIR